MRIILALALASLLTPVMAQEDKSDDTRGGGVPPQANGGPDTFGYVWADSSTDQCAVDFIDITDTGTSVVSGDDASAPVTLPGPSLDFYGETVTDIAVSTNGYLATDPSDGGGDLSNDCPLPATPSTGAGGRYYPMQDDLVVDGDTLFEYLDPCPRDSGAVADEGCYVFQWNGTTHFSGSGEFSFQAILYDTSYAIVYNFLPGNPEEGAGSTTGIQNAAFDDGLTYACDSAASIQADSSVCFYHPDAPFVGDEPEVEAVSVPSTTTWGVVTLVMLMLGLALFTMRRSG